MKVSVIIPCYNVQNYIEECVDSVLDQTYNNLEIILVDNNSSDDTFKVLNSLKDRHADLVVLSELKKGANAARNKGLQVATGDWIQFLDADDLLLPKKIEKQIDAINGAQNANFCIGGFQVIDVNQRKKSEFIPASDDIYLNIFTNKAGNTCANLFSKKWVTKAGYLNEDLLSSQETDLMFNLVLLNPIVAVEKSVLTTIRERESGRISQGDPVQRWKNYVNVRLEFLEKLKKMRSADYEKNRAAYNAFLISSLLVLACHYKDTYNDYKDFIKGFKEIAPLYGLNKFKLKLLKVIGYRLLFKLQYLRIATR